MLVFAPVGERSLAALPGMSVGILSAAQGAPSAAQLALDISQGARVASGAYGSPPVALTLQPDRGAGRISGWRAAQARARGAPAGLVPGLLASRLGGAAYAAVTGTGRYAAFHAGADAATGSDPYAAVAAGTGGHVASVSLGATSTLAGRAQTLSARRPLVVVTLPPGREGRLVLRQLAVSRRARELLLVVQADAPARPSRLLWIGTAGLTAGTRGELTSGDTRERGMLSSADVAPTILAHERVAVPESIQGSPARVEGGLDGPALRSTIARLGVIGERRLPALGWLLLVCAALVVCARTREGRRRALRVGALGVMWAPLASLLTAALAPAAGAEYALLALLCPALGEVTDRLLAWPRGVIAPAAACVAAIAIDALAGSELLMRSLLGPDPALGARFHGIGNDLKSVLAVLALAAVAAALYPSTRGRRAWLTMALVGVGLACLEGATRLGAGVGGVLVVCVSFALAAVMLLPGAPTRRRALVVVMTPFAGLIALALIDLVTAHGSGHYSGTVLHAHSAGELRDLIVRRYEAAWGELRHAAMPLATGLAVACVVAVLRQRVRVLAPVGGDPAWTAALYGSVAAGLVGSLVEDSGPVLLVTAVFTGGCVLCYLWGRPLAAADPRVSVPRLWRGRHPPDRALTDRDPFPAGAGPPPRPSPTPERASGASVLPVRARPARAEASASPR